MGCMMFPVRRIAGAEWPCGGLTSIHAWPRPCGALLAAFLRARRRSRRLWCSSNSMTSWESESACTCTSVKEATGEPVRSANTMPKPSVKTVGLVGMEEASSNAPAQGPMASRPVGDITTPASEDWAPACGAASCLDRCARPRVKRVRILRGVLWENCEAAGVEWRGGVGSGLEGRCSGTCPAVVASPRSALRPTHPPPETQPDGPSHTPSSPCLHGFVISGAAAQLDANADSAGKGVSARGDPYAIWREGNGNVLHCCVENKSVGNRLDRVGGPALGNISGLRPSHASNDGTVPRQPPRGQPREKIDPARRPIVQPGRLCRNGLFSGGFPCSFHANELMRYLTSRCLDTRWLIGRVF